MKTLKKFLVLSTVSIFFLILLIFQIQQLSNQEKIETFNNVNSQFTPLFEDEIKPGCKIISNTTFENLNNFRINLYIHDSKKWNKNIIYGKLRNGYRIAEKYKTQQYATFEIINKNDGSKCTLQAKVRISGDAADHINLEKFQASIDVELIDENIFGYTDFKLFLPETRNNENEIFVTTLLRHLNYLAPNTFFIDIFVNDQKVKYLFQEKINKTFIESNNLKEGPILEANEKIAWGEEGWFTENTLLPPRIINKSWIDKDVKNLNYGLYAIEKVHKIRIYGLDTKSLNYESLKSKNSDYLKEYQLLLTVLRSHRGLPFDDRKFYLDPYTDFLYPIYYDGQPFLFENIDGYLFFNNEDFEKVKILNLNNKNIENLTRNIETLDFEELLLDLEKKGLEKSIFKNVSNTFKKTIIDDIKSFENNLTINQFTSFLTFLNSNNLKSDQYELIFKNEENYIICEIDLLDCKNIQLNKNQIAEILSGDYYDEKLFFYMGNFETLQNNNSENYTNYKILEINNMPYEAFYVGSANFEFINNYLRISEPSLDFRLLIESETLINQKIEFISSSNNTQYSDTLLTGCVNIVNSSLKNFEYLSSGASCEDSLNIISSAGSIKNINIVNSKHDGLDIDFSKLEISDLNIKNSGNDCADFSYGEYFINNATLITCEDKGISVGEISILNLENVVVVSSEIGIAAKDSSEINIFYYKSSNNNYCAATYRKKQEFDTPKLKFDEYICDNNKFYYQESTSKNE